MIYSLYGDYKQEKYNLMISKTPSSTNVDNGMLIDICSIFV